MAVKTTVTSTGGLANHFRQIADRVEAAKTNPPQQQEKGDAGHLVCNGCGHDLGTHGEVMERAAREMALKVLGG